MKAGIVKYFEMDGYGRSSSGGRPCAVNPSLDHICGAERPGRGVQRERRYWHRQHPRTTRIATNCGQHRRHVDCWRGEARQDGGRRVLDNASYFAFTATPKNKTLELFGDRYEEDGVVKHRPFHLYSMKQAIEEGFILDVLAHYTPV